MSQSAGIVREGFSGTEIEKRREVNQSAMVAQARASIEAQYFMAMQRPRSWDDVRVKLLKECDRAGFAEAAIYGKPQRMRDPRTGRWVDGKIEGLSIRFAETAMRISGNMRAGSLTTYDDDEKRFLNVYCIDLETNAVSERAIAVTKVVERREVKEGRVAISQRLNSAGETVYLVQSTDDELTQKESALVNKAKRNLILALIPGDLREDGERRCRETRAKTIKGDPDGERKKIIDAFAELQILPSDLETYLGHPIAQIVAAELELLRGILVSLREGEARWSDLVSEKEKPAEEQVKTAKAQKVADRIKANREAKKQTEGQAAPAKTQPAPPPADADAPPPDDWTPDGLEGA
jgi:hypothetical protein